MSEIQKAESKLSMTEFLLHAQLPDVRRQLPEKRVEVKRLSKQTGQPVIFRLRGLPYGQVQTIRRMSESEAPLQILLCGCAEPDFRDRRFLRAEDGIALPTDAITALLTPGEIMDLSQEVERLSGFRQQTIAEIKNG